MNLTDITPAYFKIPENESNFAMSISAAISSSTKPSSKNGDAIIPLVSIKKMPSKEIEAYFFGIFKRAGWKKISFEQGKQYIFLNLSVKK